jgi:hypothetical protein
MHVEIRAHPPDTRRGDLARRPRHRLHGGFGRARFEYTDSRQLVGATFDGTGDPRLVRVSNARFPQPRRRCRRRFREQRPSNDIGRVVGEHEADESSGADA